MSGAKQLWRCEDCLETKLTPKDKRPDERCMCGGDWVELLKPLIRSGEIVRDLPRAKQIRDHVLRQLGQLDRIL
ncbi:MAG: hypothetical protein ACYC56_12705 [Candidatus Aquicultor sp.]